MRIGHNVHAQSRDFDKNKLLKHVSILQPDWMLVMDDLNLCRDIQAVSSRTKVIYRAFNHENDWDKISPAAWVAAKKKDIGNADVWAYCVNEGGFDDALLYWYVSVIELAAKANLKVVVGNFSVGTPRPEDWRKPAAVAFLKVLDKYRDTAIMGLHEYACGVITSGFLGGYPDNAGVAPDSGKVGRNLIVPGNWPTANEAATMTMFHCGRFRFIVTACNALGIRPPRIVLTEHGFDDVSDIKLWSDRLHMTVPYTTIRGWKSVQNQWRDWFGKALGWTVARAYFEQLKYADQAIYLGSCVEGQLIFCWGHTSEMWDQFDISKEDDLHKLLEDYAMQHTPPSNPPPVVTTPPPPPVVIPPPPSASYPMLPTIDDPRWEHVIATPKGDWVNVRSAPTPTVTAIAKLRANDELYVILSENEGIWIPVKIPGDDGLPLRGWVSTDVVAFTVFPTQEEPPLIELSRKDVEKLHEAYKSLSDQYEDILNRKS